MEKTRAILIRRFRFSETSLLCVWITESFGKLKTSARGALKAKGAFQGRLDLFFENEIAFARSRTSDIHPLRESNLLTPFDGLATRYDNLSVAAYFADLLDLATEPNEEHAREVYALLARAITYLRAHTPTYRAIVHFESELCRILGIFDNRVTADPLNALVSQCGRVPSSRQRALKSLRPTPPLAPQPPEDKMTPP